MPLDTDPPSLNTSNIRLAIENLKSQSQKSQKEQWKITPKITNTHSLTHSLTTNEHTHLSWDYAHSQTKIIKMYNRVGLYCMSCHVMTHGIAQPLPVPDCTARRLARRFSQLELLGTRDAQDMFKSWQPPQPVDSLETCVDCNPCRYQTQFVG